jgi:polysaccharide biosynthesis protein PslG
VFVVGACAGGHVTTSGRSEPGNDGPRKRVSFSVLEDYDKGEDLTEVARDFALMRELEVTTWRGSFGWDDYEPERGRLDLGWLHRFAELAREHGITLRPYIGYTAPWAAAGRDADGQTWNDPPARLEDWSAFVARLAGALRPHPAIASYEIYNEENVPLWWDGTREEYAEVLAAADRALADAAPDVALLPGGVVWPDAEWVEAICAAGATRRIAAFPFHAYPETWTPDSVTVENYLDAGYRQGFLPAVDACGTRPVWINEMGFATTPGRSEHQQADWWARAVATFLADPRIEHIGIYEIKDLRADSPVIGDTPNYHLGLTRTDRSRKLAFFTVDLLTDLLDTGTLTSADEELEVRVVDGRAGRLYHHLFVRPDGDQVLFLWDRLASPTVDVRVRREATRASAFGLDGREQPIALEDARVVRNIRLEPGTTRIFRLRGANDLRSR